MNNVEEHTHMNEGPFTISDPRSAPVGTTPRAAEPSSDGRTPEERQALKDFFPNSHQPAIPPPAGQLYGADATMQTEYRQHTDALRTVLGRSEQEVRASQAEISDTLDDLGLDAFSIGRPIYRAAVEADIAAARGTVPSAEQQRQWKEESRTILNGMGSDMGRRYEKFAQSHPTLAAILNKPGVGIHPNIVRLIAGHIRDTNYR